MTAQPRDDARIDERGRCSPRGPDHPPSGDVQFVPMLTSFAGRAGMLRQASAGIGFPRAVRGPAAAPWATTLRGRLASVRLGPSGRVSPPSSPSVPSREVPGLGLRRSPRLSTSRALRSPCRSQRSRWRSCLRRHGILLASQEPSRGHLYLYKGT